MNYKVVLDLPINATGYNAVKFVSALPNTGVVNILYILNNSVLWCWNGTAYVQLIKEKIPFNSNGLVGYITDFNQYIYGLMAQNYDFENGILAGYVFSNIYLNDGLFNKVDFKYAGFEDMVIVGAKFRNSDFTDAVFVRNIIAGRDTDFTGAIGLPADVNNTIIKANAQDDTLIWTNGIKYKYDLILQNWIIN